jgi:hypothetical protein
LGRIAFRKVPHGLRAGEAAMETLSPTMHNLLIVWGVVTAVLVCMLIYRSTLESREGDQIFLDAAEESMASEQRAIVARIHRISRPIKVLIVASGGLLLVIAGMWLWEGFKRF